MAKHLAFVERGWFQADFAGEDVSWPWAEGVPETDFVIEPIDTVKSILQLYQDEIAKSRAIVARSSLDDLAQKAGPHSLRWILVHMIEETARHAGQPTFCAS